MPNDYSEIGFVSWAYVKGISITNISSRYTTTTYICVKLVDYKKSEFFPESTQKAEKYFTKVGEWLGLSEIVISLDSSKEKPEKVFKIMQEYLKHYQSKHGTTGETNP